MFINLYELDQKINEAWINSSLLENNIYGDVVNDVHKNELSRTIWSIVLLLNITVFIISKVSLLKLTLTVRSITQNPHDTLFFIDEMEKLIVTPICTVIVVYDLLKSNDAPFTEIIPNCGIRIVFTLFPNQLFFGGLAIGLLRLIFIKYTHIVTKWGEVRIMRGILTAWHLVLIGNTYLLAVNAFDRYKNRCYGKEESSISYNPWPTFFLAIMIEFAIYISIFQYVYQRDISVKQFISAESYGRRKRKNAFNLFGHTIYFLIELIMMISGLILLISQQKVPIKSRNIYIPPKVWHLFTSTLLGVSMLLLSTPMKVKWIQLITYIRENLSKPK